MNASLEQYQADYADLKAKGLSFNLTRGKPSSEQLDLAAGLLALPGVDDFHDSAGTDVRNYGGLQGLSELREIFGELLGLDAAQLVAANNASLTLMHDVLVNCLLHGAVDSPRPWSREDSIAFICPVPGYDRHFALLESFGIEMLTVDMLDDGPDIEAVEALVAEDASIKGMWLVPTYANPTGDVCSPEVAARLAAMPTAAPDFKIFWDNAYAVHHLTHDEVKTADIISLSSASGHPERVFMFASTSKITFAGAGVAFLGSSPANVDWHLDHLSVASIGPDKVNHWRHVRFFGDAEGVRRHMRAHRDILAPKFEAVLNILRDEVTGIAEWTEPTGGYFISVDVPDGTASRVVELAKDAGIALTPAGAAFPHGRDPRDRNIRLAPSFPTLDDVDAAMRGVAVCIKLAAAEAGVRST